MKVWFSDLFFLKWLIFFSLDWLGLSWLRTLSTPRGLTLRGGCLSSFLPWTCSRCLEIVMDGGYDELWIWFWSFCQLRLMLMLILEVSLGSSCLSLDFMVNLKIKINNKE